MAQRFKPGRKTSLPSPDAETPFDLLRVAISEPLPGVLVVSPVGEIDVATASVLRDAGRRAVEIADRGIVIDLGGLTFCGSTGLVVLIEIHDAAGEAGIAFGTAGGPSIVRRVLEITGLAPLLGHADTLVEALAAAQGQ